MRFVQFFNVFTDKNRNIYKFKRQNSFEDAFILQKSQENPENP
jgi:hypothetical protein